MYIRRKVFSRFIDEYGDERLFSTTDYEYDDYGYGEKMFIWQDEDGIYRDDKGEVVNVQDVMKTKELPKGYRVGSAGGRQADRPVAGYDKATRKVLKGKVGKRTEAMKNWNKTKEYKEGKASLKDQLKELKENYAEKNELRNKLGKAKALNKGLLIGIGAAGAAGAGIGIAKAVKAKKARKERESLRKINKNKEL